MAAHLPGHHACVRACLPKWQSIPSVFLLNIVVVQTVHGVTQLMGQRVTSIVARNVSEVRSSQCHWEEGMCPYSVVVVKQQLLQF